MKITISVGGKFHAFYLARELLKRGYLHRLITSYPKFEAVKYGIPREKIRSVIIKEILWRSWSVLPAGAKNVLDLTYAIHELYDKLASFYLDKSDICVAWSSFGLKTIRKAKRLGAITIIDHGSAHIEYQDRILREEYKRWRIKPDKSRLANPKILEKELKEYKETDYISIPSLFSQKTFLEAGVQESKLLHVPYGVDTSQFKPAPKSDSVFRVVYAGGMTLQKGVHYLLQAFSELNLPNSELLLIGGLTDEIKPFFKKYEGKFRYVGSVPQTELANHYSQSSVFVLNSIHDGFGMVIIQAMACGLPVIATENTGGPDIIRDGVNGFIIPIRDVEALKNKLRFLYENPAIQKAMGEMAQKKAVSGFTWDDYGNKMIKLYENLLRNA